MHSLKAQFQVSIGNIKSSLNDRKSTQQLKNVVLDTLKNKSQEALKFKESVLESKTEVKMFDGIDLGKLASI